MSDQKKTKTTPTPNHLTSRNDVVAPILRDGGVQALLSVRTSFKNLKKNLHRHKKRTLKAHGANDRHSLPANALASRNLIGEKF